MNLLPKEITASLPSLNSRQRVKDPLVRLKLFSPVGKATWYITKGSPIGKNGEVIAGKGGIPVAYDPAVHTDFVFFAYVTGLVEDADEWGEVSLKELEALRLPLGLRVERDLDFIPAPISQFRQTYTLLG